MKVFKQILLQTLFYVVATLLAKHSLQGILGRQVSLGDLGELYFTIFIMYLAITEYKTYCKEIESVQKKNIKNMKRKVGFTNGN